MIAAHPKQDDSPMAGGVPEFDDRTTVALEDHDGDMILVFRDDDANSRLPDADPDERWFTSLADPPMSWETVLIGKRKASLLVLVADADHSPVDVHTMFGLTYANYAVHHRSLLQSMPEEWQYAYAALIGQYNEAFKDVKQAQSYEVTAGVEREVGDLSEAEMTAAGITRQEAEDSEDGEAEGDVAEDLYYDKFSNELESWNRVIVPAGSDPVPHYSRGRTHIPPGPYRR